MEIQKFPPVGTLYDRIDPEDPYRTVISGLFGQETVTATGSRPFLVYISPSNHQAEPCICILPDSSQDPRQTLECTGWKTLADRQGLIIIMLCPEAGGWDLERDTEYLDAVYAQSRLKHWYNVQKGNSHLVGYGDGARLAQAWALRRPSDFASAATFSTTATPLDLAIPTDATQEFGEAGKGGPSIRSRLPLPIWMWIESAGPGELALFEYWKTVNRADTAQIFRNDEADAVYLASPDALSSCVDELALVAQTRMTIRPDVLEDDPARTARVWDFLGSVTRTWGIEDCVLRPAYRLEDWKAVRCSMRIDGIVRHWFEFVPDRLHETQEGKVPLVVAMHGLNTTADTFLWRSEWIKLARERGCIVVFPAAALSREESSLPRPAWNIAENPGCFDDMAFLRTMIGELCTRLPVDTGRIYATGQSMGFMTCLAIALRLDDLVTAVAGETGFLLTDAEGNPYYTSSAAQRRGRMPVSVIIGERDMKEFLSESTKRTNLAYWIERNEAGSYDTPSGYYRDGRYRITTWANRDNIPLVRYALQTGRCHAPVPSDNTMLYDGFLCLWSRSPEGRLLYMGVEVR